MLFKDFFNFVYINSSSQFALHRGHVFIINATGHNVFKIVEVRINIKCKAVHRYPATATYAEGANFAGALVVGIKPNTGIAGITACL